MGDCLVSNLVYKRRMALTPSLCSSYPGGGGGGVEGWKGPAMKRDKGGIWMRSQDILRWNCDPKEHQSVFKVTHK